MGGSWLQLKSQVVGFRIQVEAGVWAKISLRSNPSTVGGVVELLLLGHAGFGLGLLRQHLSDAGKSPLDTVPVTLSVGITQTLKIQIYGCRVHHWSGATHLVFSALAHRRFEPCLLLFEGRRRQFHQMKQQLGVRHQRQDTNLAALHRSHAVVGDVLAERDQENVVLRDTEIVQKSIDQRLAVLGQLFLARLFRFFGPGRQRLVGVGHDTLVPPAAVFEDLASPVAVLGEVLVLGVLRIRRVDDLGHGHDEPGVASLVHLDHGHQRRLVVVVLVGHHRENTGVDCEQVTLMNRGKVTVAGVAEDVRVVAEQLVGQSLKHLLAGDVVGLIRLRFGQKHVEAASGVGRRELAHGGVRLHDLGVTDHVKSPVLPVLAGAHTESVAHGAGVRVELGSQGALVASHGTD